jgi:hypothetical protein
MNNIKLTGPLTKAWIEVSITEVLNDNYVVSSHIFDNTPFSIIAPSAKVEVDSNNNKKGLLEIGIVGTNYNYTEIMLPAPVLNMGYTVRMQPNQVIQTQKQLMPTKIKK